jgi:hypothetical protein
MAAKVSGRKMEIEMQSPELDQPQPAIISNEATPEYNGYLREHRKRISLTTKKLHEMGARNVVEVGGHPWAATRAMLDEGFNLLASISAEEVTKWPDELPIKVTRFQIRTERGVVAHFNNYSANVERTLFPIDAFPDTVVACEVVEHLIRAPHVMFLNINRWLGRGGKLLVTTPNGSSFVNPFHHRSPTAPYRCHCYERHSYLFTLPELNELVESCGFRITESGYWDVYTRPGLTKLYGAAASLPFGYFKHKFCQVIYCIAEKVEDVTALRKRPSCYCPSSEWEYIATPK